MSFLRADSGTIEKERLDYARILIATSALGVIKRKESLLVDGVRVVVQIMEEWGYVLGEDACLFDEENEEVASHNDNEGEHSEMEASHQVDMFVEKLAKGMEEDDGMAFQKFDEEHTLNQSTFSVNKEELSSSQEDCGRSQAIGVSVESVEILEKQRSADETAMPVGKRKGQKDINGSCGAPNENSIGDNPSSSSAKNDWENWVVMQGTDQIAVEDVCDMGKAIGVKFKGDNANIFNILSRRVKGRTKASGQMSWGGGGCERGGLLGAFLLLLRGGGSLCVLMKIISWNIMGLGRVEKRNEVRKLVKEKHPAIVCLQETKVGVCDEN
ncbi:hypothetical protein TSUD_401090, partial [Trifolium subterraneum]